MTEQEFVDGVRRNLHNDVEDVESPTPSAAVRITCLCLAWHIAPYVTPDPELKCVAFVEDDGGVLLVVHSLRAHRRLTFCMSQDGQAVSVTSIDEEVRSSQFAVSKDDLNRVRELGEWVIGDERDVVAK